MPRVSDLYAYPPGTPGVADTTIESADYNAYIDDIKDDLNLPRPIIVGGTGAGDAITALANLGGEKAKQVVTNYGSTPTGQASWLSGSFYSDAGATGAPTANAFVGFVSVQDANNMVLEACDLTDAAHPIYSRTKVGGAWSAWIKQAAFTDVSAGLAGKVDRTGDTMTGHLSLPIGPAAANAVRKDYVDAADALKAPIDSPTFTGDPKAPTPSAGDNDTSIATTAFVANAITSGAVRYDASQSLTAAQQQQARQNICAAPFDALAYSGLQINGSIDISQEVAAAGVSVSNTTKYPVDQWALASTGSQVVSGVQNAAAPPGFANALQVYATTANASPAAGNYAFLSARLEGQRIYRLGFGSASASSMTVGFWIYSTKTGVFSGAVINGASTRSYVFTFTVNAANTWEYKVITIPGDTTGTWVKDNTLGMQLIFTMMTGSTYQTAAGVWTAGVFFGVAGSVNLLANTSDFWLITGVTVLPGNEAPSAARSPFIMRPYDQELMTCRRYWQTNNFVLSGYNAAGGAIYGPFLFSPMRAAPTVTLPGWSSSNAGGIVAGSITNGSITMQATATATGAAYAAGGIVCDARL